MFGSQHHGEAPSRSSFYESAVIAAAAAEQRKQAATRHPGAINRDVDIHPQIFVECPPIVGHSAMSTDKSGDYIRSRRSEDMNQIGLIEVPTQAMSPPHPPPPPPSGIPAAFPAMSNPVSQLLPHLNMGSNTASPVLPPSPALSFSSLGPSSTGFQSSISPVLGKRLRLDDFVSAAAATAEFDYEDDDEDDEECRSSTSSAAADAGAAFVSGPMQPRSAAPVRKSRRAHAGSTSPSSESKPKAIESSDAASAGHPDKPGSQELPRKALAPQLQPSNAVKAPAPPVPLTVSIPPQAKPACIGDAANTATTTTAGIATAATSAGLTPMPTPAPTPTPTTAALTPLPASAPASADGKPLVDWQALEVPEDIWIEAQELYEKVKTMKKVQNRQPVRKRHAILAALMFILCRNQGYPRTFAEICLAAKVTKREIGMYYNLMKQVLGSEYTSSKRAKPSEFVQRWCTMLELPEWIAPAATRAYDRADELAIVQGKCPISVSAACIWLIIWCFNHRHSLDAVGFSLPEDTPVSSSAMPNAPLLSLSDTTVKKDQRDVCKAAGVVIATLTSVFKLLLPRLNTLVDGIFAVHL
ncbi:hypothetical protein GGI12_004685 [Dipsacomyces acuminosporus]|nr:hypothetical protein GGI12_004685 [Dipsacomyces acuminosporus]